MPRWRWTSTRLPSGSDGRYVLPPSSARSLLTPLDSLHTDVPTLASFLRTVGGCASTEYKHAVAHINQGAAACIAIPHAASTLGCTFIASLAHHSDHFLRFQPAPSPPPLLQAQALAGLAMLESMLATFPYPLPPANTGRRATILYDNCTSGEGYHVQYYVRAVPAAVAASVDGLPPHI
ncbi:hypothetical protein EDB85DRAFT_1949960, partial [Lactarius pseudohatsudake]